MIEKLTMTYTYETRVLELNLPGNEPWKGSADQIKKHMVDVQGLRVGVVDPKLCGALSIYTPDRALRLEMDGVVALKAVQWLRLILHLDESTTITSNGSHDGIRFEWESP